MCEVRRKLKSAGSRQASKARKARSLRQTLEVLRLEMHDTVMMQLMGFVPKQMDYGRSLQDARFLYEIRMTFLREG